MRRKGIRIIEIATVCAVVGILVSLAVPSLMQMQARARVDKLIASARSCREELPQWLAQAVPAGQTFGGDVGRAGAFTDSSASDARKILESYAELYNRRFLAEAPAVVVEPAGTLPSFCSRDGRIHIIPLEEPDPVGIAATVVVTDDNRFGGPDGDGILAVYRARKTVP